MRHRSQINQFNVIRDLLMYFLIVVLFCMSCTNDMRSVEPSIETEYSYYSNGKKEFSAEYMNGKLNGLIRHWSEDGNIISEAEYSNGMLHGIWKKYYENGKLSGKTNYSYGKKHGSETWYHVNGQLKSEQTFVYGLPEDDIIR